MKKEYIKINSDCDGLPLSVAVFTPENEVKGIVQLSHGMAEHKERYYGFMEFLADRGYACIINDHRGHGQSVRDKNDLGYFYDDTANYIVDDLHQLTEYMKQRFPSKPVCLFGHSMGSLVVRKYIKKYDSDITKLVVCGSPSRNPMVGAALALVKIQKAFKGERYRSNMIQNLAFGSYNKNIKNPVSENAWLSEDRNNVTAYEKDELCGFVFTLNGFRNLFLLVKEVYSTDGWAMKNKNLPVLFIAGADDPVIVGEKEWKQSQDFLKGRGYTNVKGKLYEGKRHEILNEGIKSQVYQDVLDFIEQL